MTSTIMNLIMTVSCIKLPLSEHNTPQTIIISSAFSLSPPKISVKHKRKVQPYEVERKRMVKKKSKG